MIDDSSPALFAQEVRNCAGSSVMLGLWSAKGQRTRALHIPIPADAPSLGLTLQWTPLSVVSNIWHVLDVPANSPADVAGLLPYSDYILGTPEGQLHGEGGLSELVEDHIGRPLRLYVYNNEYDVTREVTITPSRDWGGQGALGCVLGYGALHRLPAPLNEPVNAPGETMFDLDSHGQQQQGAQGGFMSAMGGAPASGRSSPFVPVGVPSPGPPPPPSGDFLVPAQMVSPPPPPAGGVAPPRGKKKERHGHKKVDLMDDYLKEEEARSQELDGPSGGRKTPVAPPPKAGGPPPPPRAEDTASPAPAEAE